MRGGGKRNRFTTEKAGAIHTARGCVRRSIRYWQERTRASAVLPLTARNCHAVAGTRRMPADTTPSGTRLSKRATTKVSTMRRSKLRQCQTRRMSARSFQRPDSDDARHRRGATRRCRSRHPSRAIRPPQRSWRSQTPSSPKRVAKGNRGLAGCRSRARWPSAARSLSSLAVKRGPANEHGDAGFKSNPSDDTRVKPRIRREAREGPSSCSWYCYREIGIGDPSEARA